MRTEDQIMNRAELKHERYGNLSAPDDLGFQKRFIKGFAVCVLVGGWIAVLVIIVGGIIYKML